MVLHMMSAVKQGKALEKDIDEALHNLFLVQLHLGIFNGRNHFRGLGPKDVCSSEHKKLALEAALQGIVLLKNEKKILPLDNHVISSLAVIGPLSNSTELGGGYTGMAMVSFRYFRIFRSIDTLFSCIGEVTAEGTFS